MRKKIFLVVLLFALLFVGVYYLMQEKQYTVSFYVDGQVVSTVKTKGNENINLPSNPSKTDYLFDGWFVDEDVWNVPFTSNYLADKKLKNNLNVYAKFSAIQCQLSFDINGGTGSIDSISYAINSTVTVPTDDGISRENYFFTAWNTSADGTGSVYIAGTTFTITENITLYAQWQAIPRSVTYMNGSEQVERKDFNAGNNIELNKTLTKDYHRLAGWSTTENAEHPTYAPGQVITPTENMILYAYWVNVRGSNYPFEAVSEATDNSSANLNGYVAFVNSNQNVDNSKSYMRQKFNAGIVTFYYMMTSETNDYFKLGIGSETNHTGTQVKIENGEYVNLTENTFKTANVTTWKKVSVKIPNDNTWLYFIYEKDANSSLNGDTLYIRSISYKQGQQLSIINTDSQIANWQVNNLDYSGYAREGVLIVSNISQDKTLYCYGYGVDQGVTYYDREKSQEAPMIAGYYKLESDMYSATSGYVAFAYGTDCMIGVTIHQGYWAIVLLEHNGNDDIGAGFYYMYE